MDMNRRLLLKLRWRLLGHLQLLWLHADRYAPFLESSSAACQGVATRVCRPTQSFHLVVDLMPWRPSKALHCLHSRFFGLSEAEEHVEYVEEHRRILSNVFAPCESVFAKLLFS